MRNPMMDVTDKSPVYVHCKPCGYEWILFFTPLAVEDLAKFKDAACPKCCQTTVMMGKKETPDE